MERIEFLKQDLMKLRKELEEYQEMQIKALEELSKVEDLNELDSELETVEQFEEFYEDLEHDFNKECEKLLKDVIRINKEMFSNMIDLKWQQLKEKEGVANV